MRRQTSCAAPGWSVSCTDYHDPARGVVLHVRRQITLPARGLPMVARMTPGDADGRVFTSSREAFAFALERGYMHTYRQGWCPRCRRQHWFCGARSGPCAAARGQSYPGCEAAQRLFDAEDRSHRRPRPGAPGSGRGAAAPAGARGPVGAAASRSGRSGEAERAAPAGP